MKFPRFGNISDEDRDLVDAYLDGKISSASFELLQDRMAVDAELRAVMRRYLSLDHSLRSEGEGDINLSSSVASKPWCSVADADLDSKKESEKAVRFSKPASMGIAASIAFLLGLALMYWGQVRKRPAGDDIVDTSQSESFAQGFAVIGRLFDVEWSEDGGSYREGDTLAAQDFVIKSGAVEIQFFSGATMVLEGPAQISLKSAWEASCHEGAIRMQVPPAARGFKLHGPSTEIIDLGTEFGLLVREGKGHVEVFDGEIALRHRGEDEQLLLKGGALGLALDGPSTAAASGEVTFPDALRLRPYADRQLLGDFRRWQKHRDTLAKDERLIAYYTFDQELNETLIPNLALPRNTELGGVAVLAERVSGRWPGMKSALEFRRPGSRVRVNIPQEYEAFTFACWVRIDSLDRLYNALFMGDGYEDGEPHWQIKDDGRLMLSVMVDETRRHPEYPKSRYHHVYFSPSIWDLSMSGKWVHIVSVFDPKNREVSHYVDGEQISREAIDPAFQIDTLRIGNAEIGNWGQPFREDPTFAIRNLNGRIDEVAIFGVPLTTEEVQALYQGSRSESR